MYQALYSSKNGKIYSRGERRREKDEWRKTRGERKGGRASPILSLPILAHATSRTFKGDVTRDDSQRRFFAQHIDRCNVGTVLQPFETMSLTTLCCAKNRRCESFLVTSP